MPDGSEFHTAEAATLKPLEANAVRSANTRNGVVMQKGAKVSRLNATNP